MKPVIAADLFDTLYQTARAFAEEVATFRPEIVIALAHSGWLPAHATRIIWQATREEAHPAEAFPPLIRINLGREKHNALALWRKLFEIPDLPFADAEQADMAQVLAWSAGQQQWRRELWQLVRAAWTRPGAPARILIIDELYSYGRTMLFALGLVDAVFPESEVELVAGRVEWPLDLFRLWLGQRDSGAADRLGERMQVLKQNRERDEEERLRTAMRAAVAGTVDVNARSLAWRPLAATDVVLDPLLSFLPPEALLEVAPWLESTLGCEMAARAREGALAASGNYRWVMKPAWRLLAWIGRNWTVTVAEAADILGVSPAEARAHLEGLVEEGSLALLESGSDARYILSQDYEPDESRFY